MKKLLLVASFFLLAAIAQAQTAYTGITRNITATGQFCSSSSRCKIIGTGAAYHQLTWNVSGTLSACSVQVDSSADGITWNSGNVIAAQTCTSNGTITSTSNVVNYTRVNVTAITPVSTANLTVNITGFVNLPSGGGTVTNIATTAPITGGPITTTGTLACANCIVANPTGSQTIQGPATNSTLTLLGTVGTSSTILEIHNSFASGINLFTHSDTSFRSPAINWQRSRGTQASPTQVQVNDPLGTINFWGMDNAATYRQTGQVAGIAADAFTSAGFGSYMSFNLVNVASTNLQERFRITGSGVFTNATSIIGWGLGTIQAGITNPSAQIIDFGNGTTNDTSAKLKAAAYMSVGTKFTSNGGCTEGTTVGGATAGKFTVGQNTACTVVITMGNTATAPNGWTCVAYDQTAVPAVAIRQTASNATTCSLLMTVATNDVITFSAMGY